jgi:hypothetical protein
MMLFVLRSTKGCQVLLDGDEGLHATPLTASGIPPRSDQAITQQTNTGDVADAFVAESVQDIASVFVAVLHSAAKHLKHAYDTCRREWSPVLSCFAGDTASPDAFCWLDRSAQRSLNLSKPEN